MYRQLHDSLSRAAEAARLRDCLRAQRETLAAGLAVERARLTALGSQLDRERKDVERLEGISLERVAAAFAGDREDRLAKERREAVSAELRYAEHSELVAEMITELDAIDRRIAELGDVDALHLAAMDEKARMLVARGDEHGRLVAGLVEQFWQACAMDRELREALACGNELWKHLTAAMSNLAAALRNDSWDVIGGHLAAAAKHDAIKRAARGMQSCRILLARFHEELTDVGRGLSSEAPYQVLSIRRLPGPSFFDSGWGGIYDAEIRGELKHVGRALGFVRYEVQRCAGEVAQALQATQRARQELWARLYEAIRAG
jgi:hypothetical protein